MARRPDRVAGCRLHRVIRTTSWHPAVEDNTATALAFADGGEVLEAAYPGAIGIWDPTGDAGIAPQSLGGLVDVWSEAFSPDGKLLATASGDGIIQLWNVATRQQIGGWTAADKPSRSTRWPSARTANSWPQQAVTGQSRIWNPATQSQIGSPMNTGQRMSTVRFNPTGTTLITAGSDGSTELWNVASHDRDGAPLTAPGAGSVTSLAISPAADSLATETRTGTSSCGTRPCSSRHRLP